MAVIGMATEADLSTVNVIIQGTEPDICLSDFGFCTYTEKVFADLSDSDGSKNDLSTFLVQRQRPLDTITFELWKGGSKLLDISNSDYGTYYENFTVNNLLSGLVLDWRLVAQLQGFGNYQIKVSKSILGNDSVDESRLFQLLPYSASNANNTFVIKSYLDGNIVSGIDYTGLLEGGWLEQYRIEGRFFEVQPESEFDQYLSTTYVKTTIQNVLRQKYNLETRFIPSSIWEGLKRGIVATETYVSDYNILAKKLYRNIPVQFDGVENFPDVPLNPNIAAVFGLSDRSDSFRQRRF